MATQSATLSTAVSEPFRALNKPHQPRSFNYPTRTFGNKNPAKRAFRAAWFERWSWLHYDKASDLAFCFLCRKAGTEGKLKAANKNLLFISKGFSNWKDATVQNTRKGGGGGGGGGGHAPRPP